MTVGPGWQAADLGAIRRSGELIDMLAGRRVPAPALGDPAVAMLDSLARDVDGAASPVALDAASPVSRSAAWPVSQGAAWPVARGTAPRRPGQRHRARHARPGRSRPGRSRLNRSRLGRVWPHAAAAAVAAAIATLTAVATAGLVVIGMFARLRGPQH